MRHRKKHFSYFVLNPCYITPCFVNQCFVSPCFINPCFVNPVQSMSYHMPKNTRCPWETHVTWLLQTGCSCMCGYMCLSSVGRDSSWVQLLRQSEIQHQFSASAATSRNIWQRSSLRWHCSLKHWHWLRVLTCNYWSPVIKKHKFFEYLITLVHTSRLCAVLKIGQVTNNNNNNISLYSIKG